MLLSNSVRSLNEYMKTSKKNAVAQTLEWFSSMFNSNEFTPY